MSSADMVTVARQEVSNGTFSEQSADRIFAAACKQSEDRLITQKEISQIAEIIRNRNKGVTFGKIPLGIRILSIFLIVSSLVEIFAMVEIAMAGVNMGLLSEALKTYASSTVIIVLVAVLVNVAATVLSFIVGVRLLRGLRGKASLLINVNMALTVATAVCELTLFGAGWILIFTGLHLLAQLILSVYLSPEIVREAELLAKLHRLDTETRAKTGMLGLADPGKGFIRLDFFNIFWTFVVCCVLGLIVEIIWHMVVVNPGVYQDRAGLLFGPFSPIYGIGAVLMTISLNRLKDKNLLILFAACTVIGGGFEYFVHWFMEVAFGAIAWDYHGKLLGDLFDGRTCLTFAMMFGALGVIWVKILLPLLLKLINKIPWRLRAGITAVCAVLMLVNGIMTFQALDNWSARKAGHVPATPAEQFYADNFDDDWMANRFQSMTINPEKSVRA